jgi:hypothetical protein
MARLALVGALVCLLGACGGGGSGTSGEGSLTLHISTTGTEVDPDGYSIRVDADTPQLVAVNDTLELQHLAAQIRTFTYGPGDPDGYVVWIGTIRRVIELTGAIAVLVGPGTYEVLLDRVPAQCSVDDPNPAVVSVAPDAVESVTFEVCCARG